MRKKLKHKIAIPQMEQARDVLPDNLSREEMTQIIADAIVLAEREKIQAKKREGIETEESKQNDWEKTLGYNDPSQLTGIKKYGCIIKNFFVVFWKFIRYPEDKISGDTALTIIQKLILSLFFSTLQILFIVSPGIHLLIRFFIWAQTGVIPWLDVITWTICLAIVGLLFGGLFRMASIEIDKCEDGNYLSGVSASVIGLLTLIITIISVVK